MKILIVEDEEHAAQRLEKLMKEIEPAVEILAKIDSVKRSVEWLCDHPAPDLIFMDIHLADGISFSIFDKCNPASPIIFTTAYDAYALKAFKVNSIDYILKPVDKAELQAALNKFRSLTREKGSEKTLLTNIEQAIEMLTKKFKSRFVVKVGEHLRTIEVSQIHYFYSQDKATFCHTADGRNFILDYSLEQLEEMVDPSVYYRINRKYLVGAHAIKDLISYTNSRLKLVLINSADHDIIVARERVQHFKAWLDR